MMRPSREDDRTSVPRTRPPQTQRAGPDAQSPATPRIPNIGNVLANSHHRARLSYNTCPSCPARLRTAGWGCQGRTGAACAIVVRAS
eukprot:580437-Prymnesium_polylepis.3